MDPRRWQLIKEIFEQAVELPEGERREFLARRCGGDEEMLGEVLDLVAADAEEQSVLDDERMLPAFSELLRRDAAAVMKGRRIGPYEIVQEIGRGGMAVVYEAVRADRHYRRRVALKLIKRGMETAAVIARFRQERQILAQLDHPAIARLYDGGVTDDGLPYLVMELVEGEPIDEYCERRALKLARCLELFREVAKAVHFAHRNLVVHRDLKPSNILVTADGVPKLLDFGIAKLLEPTSGTRFISSTVFGQRPMTPEYASPEQIRGDPVTTASDVYSLGVLLYRLLTGQRPYRFASTAMAEVERVICDESPERPSTAVSRVEARPGEPPRIAPERLQRVLRGDLDNIVLMALRKEPDRRYASAEQLAEDLRRYQAGLPVMARQDTPLYRASKFVRRNRISVAAGALVFLSLVVGIVATTWQARVAQTQRLTAQRSLAFLVDLFEVSHPGKAMGETITAREILDRGAERIEDELADEPEVRATLIDTVGLAYFKLGLYERAESLIEEALEIRRGLDPGTLEFAASLSNLGELRRVQARYEEAEELHRQALELRRALAPGSPAVADSEGNLALALYGQEDYDAAEALLREGLEWQKKILGEDHTEVAANLNNLGLVLKAKSQIGPAEEYFRRAVQLNLRHFGAGHPNTFASRRNLADLLRSKGAFDEALELYGEILAEERKALGQEDHPDLAKTLNNMAGCLLDKGEIEEAEKLFRRSLALRRQAHQTAHPDEAESLNNLARLAHMRGDLEAAEELSREALSLYEGLSDELGSGEPGSERHELSVVLSNLAATLVRKGKYAEAEEIFERVHDLYLERFGAEHVLVAGALNNLAFVLARQNRHQKAEKKYREALALYRELLGPESPEIADISRNLGETLLALGRAGEAEEWLREASVLYRDILGENHRTVALTEIWLGRALLDQGKAAEALPHLLEAFALWESFGERGRRGAAVTRAARGNAFLQLGRLREAEEDLLAGYNVLNDAYGASHPQTIEALEGLVEVYRQLGDAEKERRMRSLLQNALGDQG